MSQTIFENNDNDIIELNNRTDIMTDEDFDNTNYDEVVSLTEYEGNRNSLQHNGYQNQMSPLNTIPDYLNINTVAITQQHQIEAKNFVNKIAKFVTNFNDEYLTEEHKDYIKAVAELQISDLADMLSLVDINRKMLNNIIERINSSQLEDYAIVNSYNMMVNQHLKLIKELQTHYKNIPNVLKKMKSDIMTDQLLDKPIENDGEIMAEDYGETQFNNHKEMLRILLSENDSKSSKETNSEDTTHNS